MSDPTIDEVQGNMPKGEMTRAATGAGTKQGAAKGFDMALAVMPGSEGEMPGGIEGMTGTSPSQHDYGEMPRGAMERMSTMPRAGLASAAGFDMTTGAASGDVMPRGDNQRLASSDGAGDGEMPRGQMGDASGATVAMPGAEARGLSAMPRSGMKVTGTWTVTVSGIALGA